MYSAQQNICCGPKADILSELTPGPSAREELYFFHCEPTVFVLIHGSENALVRSLKFRQRDCSVAVGVHKAEHHPHHHAAL
jgi:hypothetical protein